MLATSHAELGKVSYPNPNPNPNQYPNPNPNPNQYRRAAEYFNRALAASNTVYGKGHVLEP
eukprot:scaffold105577_cov45-Phaeocystis_antarctica.AAC.2